MTAARNDEADEPGEPAGSGGTEVLELVGTDRVRRRPRMPSVNLSGPAVVWIGIGIAALGFILIGIGWGQLADETQVADQLPYLVSAGLTGLGLIMVGLTVINVSAKRRDAADREHQIDQLVNILEQVKDTVGEPAGSGGRTQRGGRRR